jgi:hypothetical protein
MSLRSFACFISLSMLGACAGSNVTAHCADPSPKLIFVHVFNGTSGAPAGSGATLVVRSGTYSDSVVAPTSSQADTAALAAGDRPGVYVVSVRKTGFIKWTHDSVIVDKPSFCANPTPVSLSAQLQVLN